VSGQCHAPAVLPSGKSHRYPLDSRLGGPQSRSGRCGYWIGGWVGPRVGLDAVDTG
jgi:hypothetical protein